MAVVTGRATWETVAPGPLPGDPLVIVETGPSRGVKMRRSQAIAAGFDVPAADQEPEEPEEPAAEEPKKQTGKNKRRKPEGDK